MLSGVWKRMIRQPPSLVGFALITAAAVIALFAPWLSIQKPLIYKFASKEIWEVGLYPPLKPPSWSHPFGTNDQGQDIWSRVAYGARLAWFESIIVLLGALLIGVPVGLLAGYFGSWWDWGLMRITDIFMSFPFITFGLLVAALFQAGLASMILALVLVTWPLFARLSRGQAMVVREQVYIQAAKALGAHSARILIRHVLPNCLTPIIIQAAMRMGIIIISTSALSFLGVGAPAGWADWGRMTREGFYNGSVLAPWWWAAPGSAILLFALGWNLFSEALHFRKS